MHHSAYRTVIAALLIATTFAETAFAGPNEDAAKALAAYERRDYVTARRLLLPLAKDGYAEAQNLIGTMYKLGEGGPPDQAEARKWYRKAADQGNAYAQSSLGMMHEKGEGGPQDYAEARKWYRKAGDQGFPLAQSLLGMMLASGEGGPRDYVEAGKWLRKAADQGIAAAQSMLGALYYKGNGVPQDYVEAHKWFALAVSHYPASEATNRSDAAKYRDMVAAKMTPQQIAEAQKLATQWKPTK